MAATIVSGLPSGCALGQEGRRGRIDRRREHERGGGIRRRLRRLQRDLGGLGNLAIDRREDGFEIGFGRDLLAEQEGAHPGQRIAQRFGLALLRRLVETLIV